VEAGGEHQRGGHGRQVRVRVLGFQGLGEGSFVARPRGVVGEAARPMVEVVARAGQQAVGGLPPQAVERGTVVG
jgi:hypothetical protein